MKIRYLKLKRWLLMAVMGWFGVTSCQSGRNVAAGGQQPEEGGRKEAVDPSQMAVMYGVPQMDFEVKGRVVDAEGRPVEGMQVVLVNQTVDIAPDYVQEDNPYVQDYIRSASDTTDAEGRFVVVARDVPVDSQRVMVRDIDGDRNGRYQDQMLHVGFTAGTEAEKEGPWYQGKRTKEMDIVVEKKQ